MLRDDVQIVSVDDHVIEHPRVWLDRMPAKFQDDAPRIERAEDGNDYWIYEGKAAGNFALNAVAGKPYEEFANDPRTYDDMLDGCYKIVDRLKDMDTDGVHAQLCFPNFAGFAGGMLQDSKNPELAEAVVKAYNDFMLDEWCAYNPERQIPLLMLPYWDLDASVAELERTMPLGARSYTFPETPNRRGLPSWHTDHWDPILSRLNEANIPLSLHFGSGGMPPVSEEGATSNFTVTITAFSTSAMLTMSELLLSPVFHKFPNLRMALSEGSIGWLPYMLERAQEVWRRHRFYNDVNQDVSPMDLWNRGHLAGCFIQDYAGIEMRHLIGVDHIMFESDYPHSDSNWPHTRKLLAEALVDVPDDECKKMVEDNARAFYNFPRVS